MERVVKLQSINSINQEFTNAGGNNPTKKIVDFKIPEGGVYDLSSSYIALDMELLDPTAALDDGSVPPFAKMALQVETNTFGTFAENHVGNGSLFVRNAQMYSQKKQTMLESIRRVDTLGLLKQSLEKDDQEIQRNLHQVGHLNEPRGKDVFTTAFGDEVRITNGDGLTAALEGVNKSRNRPNEQRIYLHELFGLGKAPLFSTDVYGEVRINCELNLDRMKAAFAQGSEDTNAAGVAYNAITNASGANIADNSGVSVFVTEAAYNDDFELECPFAIGQVVTAAKAVGAGAVTDGVIIDITYLAATKKLQITTHRTLINNTSGGAVSYTGITLTPVSAGVPTIRIRNCELNLTEVMDADPSKVPSEINYITYSTEEMNGNNLTTVNKTAHIEPNCQTLYVANCPSGKIAPARKMVSYRIAIDNEDQTGNRDVVAFKELHKDRIIRAYTNKNVALKNLELCLYRSTQSQALMRSERNSVIVEATEMTDEEKLVQLEITSVDGNQDIILYKELMVSK